MMVLKASLVDSKDEDSVARLVMEKHEGDGWAKALEVSAKWWEAFRPTTTANSTWISLNQALVPPFALTLHDGKIRAIFGIRFRVSNRAVGLMGDRLTVGQMVLQPQMYQSAGSMADQTKHLNKLSFNPPALDGAIEALAGGASLVEPATEDAGTAVTVPALLVVHPKIGALFIDGLLPLGALMAARTIRTAVPEAPVATELLVNFCLAAATADTTSSAQSELSVLSANPASWIRLEPHSEDGLPEWYLQYLSVTLPTRVKPTQVVTAALPAAPRGGHDELVEALVHRLANPAGMADRESDGRRYQDSDLALLHNLCGIPPEARDGDRTISKFFREFRAVMGTARGSRRFCEAFRNDNIQAAVEYPFFWDTQLLTDIRHLEFCGGDQWYTWADRFRGVSLFSWAPAEETSTHTSTRDKALAYEDTEAMHSPGERQAMAKLGGLMPAPPLDRQRLWNWVDHFRAMLLMMFEDECPLLPPLTTIRQLLYNAPLFGTWGRKNFANLTWRIHQGIRHFFTTNGVLSPITRVAGDLMAMHPFAEDTAPLEYLPAAKPTPVPRTPPENPQKRAADEPPGSKRQKTASAAPFSTSWQADIERARRATPKGITFNASVIAHDQPARDAIFGQPFLQLVDGPPCFRHFVMGRCGSGAECRQAHTTRSNPPQHIITGIRDRVVARVNHLVANPNEFGRAGAKR